MFKTFIHLGQEFAALQMLGQLFVAALFLLRLLAGMFGDYRSRFFDRIGQTVGRIRRVVRVPQVELQLVGIFEVAFAPFEKAAPNQFGNRQLLFLNRLILFDDLRALFGDGRGHFTNQRLTSSQIVGDDKGCIHARQHSDAVNS